MNDSKIYLLLLIFNKKELRELEKFVESPFFNTDKSVVWLLKWLKKHLENKKTPPTKQMSYIRTFANKSAPSNPLTSAEAQALNVVSSKLTQLVFNYLTWKKLEKNEVYKQHLLLQSFLENNAPDLFRLHFTKIYPQNKIQQMSAATYYNQHLLEYDFSRWNLLQKHNIQQKDNLQSVSDNLTLYYLIQQLELGCEMLSFSRAYKTLYNYDALTHALEMARLPQFRDHALIKIYSTAVLILKDEQTIHFEQLKHLLDIHEHQVARRVLNDMYILATNFCTRRIIAGQTEYLEELFQIYQLMSEKNLLTEGEYIPVGKMKNIISVACQLRHFDWIRQLIEDSKMHIAPHFRESVYSFGIGVIHFYKGELRQAISHLIRVDDIDINYHLSGRFVLMKAYYDLDEDFSERTEQIFKSFIAYIKHNKVISTVNKEGYTNFTKTLISLYRIKHMVGKRSLEVVENRLQNYQRVSDKKWLLEKISELK